MADPPRPNIVHRDTSPPAFKTLEPSAGMLWPPNHKMARVSIAAEADPAPAVRIVSVSSNERVDGPEGGRTSPDWVITGDLTVDLRAERSEDGTGRVYTIAVEARDASGNTTIRTVEVEVPLER